MFVLQIDDKVSIHAKREVVEDIIIHAATCHQNPLADGSGFLHVDCAFAYLKEQGVRVEFSEFTGGTQ